MDFVTESKAHPGVMGFGVLIGLIVGLLVMWVYYKYSSEFFENPNSMSQAAQDLYAYHFRSDPKGIGSRIGVYGTPYAENMKNPAKMYK